MAWPVRLGWEHGPPPLGRARSSRSEYGVVQAAACIMKTCSNIFNFEIWQLLDDPFRGKPRCEKVEHVCDTTAYPAYTRPSSTLGRINGDSVGYFHSKNSPAEVTFFSYPERCQRSGSVVRCGGQASAGLWTWAGLRCDVHWSRPLPAGWEVRGGRRQGTASPLSRRRPLPKPAFGRRFANTYRGRLSACPRLFLMRPAVRPVTLRSRVGAAQAKTGSTLSGPSDGPIPGSAAQTTANA